MEQKELLNKKIAQFIEEVGKAERYSTANIQIN